MIYRGLDPIINDKTRILILGSFPSVASLRRNEYYANPQNQFWRLIGDLFGADIMNCAYKDKIKFLLNHGIGIWDVIKSCRRAGSSDSKIRDASINDLNKLLRKYQNIEKIFFNGRKAEKVYRKNSQDSLNIEYLPSSSPAFAMAYIDKKKKWGAILSV